MTFSIAMVPVPTASSTRHAQKPAGSRRFRAARSYFERHQPTARAAAVHAPAAAICPPCTGRSGAAFVTLPPNMDKRRESRTHDAVIRSRLHTFSNQGRNRRCVNTHMLHRVALSARRVGVRRAWTVGAVAVGFSACEMIDGDRRAGGLAPAATVCDARPLTDSQKGLPAKLEGIVGSGGVRQSVNMKGARIGSGTAFLEVKPSTIQQALDVLQACVDANACIIPQGANTGLTGGSVPRPAGSDLDRPTVVMNTSKLSSIIPIDSGEHLVCLAGAGIYNVLTKAASLGRESHSVLGSIFLNPTTAAGVAFGSGGTQSRKVWRLTLQPLTSPDYHQPAHHLPPLSARGLHTRSAFCTRG